MASALAEADLVDEAIGYYEEAARMDCRYGPARWNLAKIFKSVGKYDWSAKVFEDLTKAAPGDFRPFGELGFLYRNHLGDVGRARHWWYESLRLNPRQPQIIAALAETEGEEPQEQGDRAGSMNAHAARHAPVRLRPEEQPPASAHAASQATEDVQAGEGTQTSESPQEGEGLQTSTAGHLELFEADIDLGTVIEGRQAVHTLTFENVGPGPLSITEIETSCGCVSAELGRTTYAPGERGEVIVGMQTAGKGGEITEWLTFKSDDPVRPLQKVSLYANVVPEMTTDPADVRLSLLPGERPGPFSIAVMNNDGLAFEVERVTSPLDVLHFDWPGQAVAATHVVHVSCHGPIAENHDGAIEIHTSSSSHRIVAVSLHVTMRMPAETEPSLVYLGRVARDRRVDRTVSIRAVREDLSLDLRMAETERVPGLEARLRKANDAGTRWVLDIRVDGPSATPGIFRHTVRIAVAGCDKLIEVPIYGHVAEQDEASRGREAERSKD